MSREKTLFTRCSGLRPYVYSIACDGGEAGVQYDLKQGRVTLSQYATVGDLAEAIAAVDAHELPARRPLPMVGEVA